MATGYVFEINKNTFGVLTYYPNTSVEIIRVNYNPGVYAMVVQLQRERHSMFDPADQDQIAWGKLFVKEIIK